jgi:hypothetical protein
MVNVFYLCNLEMIWDKQQESHLLEAPLGKRGGDYFQNLCILEHGQEKGGDSYSQELYTLDYGQKKGD